MKKSFQPQDVIAPGSKHLLQEAALVRNLLMSAARSLDRLKDEIQSIVSIEFVRQDIPERGEGLSLLIVYDDGKEA